MAIATPNYTGGYDHNFVDTLSDRLICKTCRLPSRDPFLSVCCGHLFCKSCLNKAAHSIVRICPVCRDKDFVTFPNKAIDREIKNLHIYCINKDKGCEWQGELNDINNHLAIDNSDGCQFEEVFECECGISIQLRNLNSHEETECPYRKVNCQYCNENGEHQFIEGQHKEECPKLPLPCPNKCIARSVPRENMKAHRKKCPLEMIRCEYSEVGCKTRMARKDKVKHENEEVKEHLMMTKHRLSEVEYELANTKTQLATVITQATNLTTILMNEGLIKKFGSHVTIRCMYLDNLVAMHKCVNICPVTIKMPEYDNHVKDEVDWYSDSFYTHNKGYKMCLNVDAAGNGDGKGTHLSVFLYLMKGPNDNKLKWPLRGKFKITLLNQISDSEHHSMMVTYDDDTSNHYSDRVTEGNRSKCGWGCQEYICNENLMNNCNRSLLCNYLENDCLFFQVTVL